MESHQLFHDRRSLWARDSQREAAVCRTARDDRHRVRPRTRKNLHGEIDRTATRKTRCQRGASRITKRDRHTAKRVTRHVYGHRLFRHAVKHNDCNFLGRRHREFDVS